jgi:hypothetical protein
MIQITYLLSSCLLFYTLIKIAYRRMIMGKIVLLFFFSVLIFPLAAYGQFTAAFWGDCRSNTDNAFENICGYLINEKGETVDVHWQNGDFSHRGSHDSIPYARYTWDQSWAIKNVNEACTRDYLFMCTSNHDTGPNGLYSEYLDSILPSNGANCFYYYCEWPIPGTQRKVHLLAMDNYLSGIDQMLYFSAILDTIDPEDWICCLFHEPVFTGMSYKDGNQGFRDYVIPMVADHGADFVLNGHAHVFRRSHVLNDNGSVTETTGGPGIIHISPEGSRGIVHIINGRGGIFSDDSTGEGWAGNAFAPTYTTPSGLVTLMTFTEDTAYIKTIAVGSDYKESGVIDEFTWVRGRVGPDTFPPYLKSLTYQGAENGTSVTLKAVTNEDAYLKFSTTDMDYSSMTNSFTGGQGRKIHTVDITGGQGQTYVYYVRAIDDSGNAMDTSAVISFTVDTLQAGLTWKDPGYDDRFWEPGQGALGFGEGQYATLVFPAHTCYFRKSFQVDNASALSDLILSANLTGGTIIYLNGTEIARFGLPAGPVTYDTPTNASINTKGEYADLDLSQHLGLLKDGENLLAIEVHQDSGGGSIRMDMGLKGGTRGPDLYRSSSQSMILRQSLFWLIPILSILRSLSGSTI